MSFLILLPIVGLWLVVCGYWAYRAPKWLGMQRLGWILSLFVFPVLVVVPVVDELVGMRQFEQLCKERAVVHVSPEVGQVKRAKTADLPTVDIPGYWISIRSQPVVYLDADTGKPFIAYEGLHTKGGRIAGIALMGGMHSCWPKNETEILKRINIDKLIEEGKKS